MVTHACLHVLYAEFAVGYNPERHVLGIGILAESPREVLVERVVEMPEEAPHACVAETTAAEVGCSVGVLP